MNTEIKEMIFNAAIENEIAPNLLYGLVITESSGNPYALRVERGFWRRYYAGIVQLFSGSMPPKLSKWIHYPDLISASYGLCQIMLPVAVENGFDGRFPTELLNPRINLSLGAKILSKHISKCDGNIERGLLRYNGGGDKNYPNRVFAAAVGYESA